MEEFTVNLPRRTTAALQIVASNRKEAKLPVSSLRETIYRRYANGESDIELAQRLKMPVGSIRLTLRGYDQINRRLLARTGLRELRETHQEVATEVWADMQRRAA